MRKVVENFDPAVNDWTLASDMRFLYDGWNLIAELVMSAASPSPTLLRTYTWGSDLSGSLQGAGGVGGLLFVANHKEQTTQAPTYDGNGNITAWLDMQNQRVLATYEYDGFGKVVLADESGAANPEALPPLGFSTKYTDRETGLLYYGYRFYAPEVGRWLNRDPIKEEGGLNLYGMVGNDAVNYVDILGLLEIHMKNIKNKDKDCPSTIAILIGGAMDKSTGLAKNNIPYDVYAGWGERGVVQQFVAKLKKCCPNAKISVLGHSYGGDSALSLVQKMPEVEFDQLITIDPVGRIKSAKTKPNNVGTWINSYQDQSTSSTDNKVAAIGGHWGSVDGATLNIKAPAGTTHGQAGKIFKALSENGSSAASTFDDGGYNVTAQTGSEWGPKVIGTDSPSKPFVDCRCK